MTLVTSGGIGMCKRGKIILIILSVVVSVGVKAQSDGIYSQYMHIKHYYNPATVGEGDLMKIFLAQRLQWIGIKNAPKTTLFTTSLPFKVKKTNHAVGIQFVNDMYGIFSNQQINAQYNYKFKFDYGTLSLGANLGVVNLICYGDSVHMVESEYHTDGDPAVPTGKQSGVGFDCGVGVYFSNARWYAGISALHLPGANILMGDKYHYKLQQVMTAVGGYNFTLRDKRYQLKPSILVYTDFASWQMYLSLLLDYNHKFWGGISYSIQNAVSFSFGAEIINGLELGYCYDLPASSIIRASHGSHELYLSYDFNVFAKKTATKHKSIRIL
ncbi:MAG: PorP/SprF family type IX secretion system membrane protein [Paludibacteraceae bacterium]|nr:PorP/SprF family type IX secretion system membrane protein [Paludibacteraceae bacterium]